MVHVAIPVRLGLLPVGHRQLMMLDVLGVVRASSKTVRHIALTLPGELLSLGHGGTNLLLLLAALRDCPRPRVPMLG